MKLNIVAFLFAASMAVFIPGVDAAPQSAPPVASVAAPKLHAAMRELWQGHVTFTRAYAMAVKAGDTAAAKASADNVVNNAKSIAAAVAGYYGKPAGDRMLALLAGHWGAVQTLTDARHANDDAGYSAAMKAFTSNVDDIAKFLSGANPNLPEDTLRSLLMAHGGHHAAQIAQIMQGESAAEAETWKAMKGHMDVLADALADGIAKQFPAKAT